MMFDGGFGNGYCETWCEVLDVPMKALLIYSTLEISLNYVLSGVFGFGCIISCMTSKY